MKYFLLLLASLVAAGLLSCSTAEQDSERDGDTALTGLPWQIERLPGGDTRVFGITPGQTTLEAALAVLGGDMELAIIAAPRERGALEVYYRHYAAGPITGSLILVLDVAAETLVDMRARAQQDAGTRRYLLHPDDLPVAYRARVEVITFLPSLDLDEAIAQARFGVPAEVVRVDARQQHWLYPDKGLDVVLNMDGRDVLQYLSPRAFSAHRRRLQPAGTTGARPVRAVPVVEFRPVSTYACA